MKTILFDLDGTLTDPEEGITKCAQYALAHFGINIADRKKLRHFIGPPLTESFEGFYGLTPEQSEQAVEKYRERFRDTGIFENRPYEGIGECLSALKSRGMRLAVATSKPEIFALRILEKFGLSQYFEEIAGISMDSIRSPKAEVIKDVLARLGVSDTQDVYMTGDRRQDIIAGKKCGLKTVVVRYGFAEPGELEDCGADHIVETVEELEKFFLAEETNNDNSNF